jgi:hypothetical protein
MMKRGGIVAPVAGLALLAGVACGGGDLNTGLFGDDGRTAGTDGIGGTADGSEGGPGGPGGSGNDDADPDDGTSAGLPGEGCNKVDFLFVIDNSLSMGDEQVNLINSVPSFLETIKTKVGVDDYQVMATTTDAEDKWYEKLAKCYDKCDDKGWDPNYFCNMTFFSGVTCGNIPPLPEGCDIVLGAGRTVDKGDPPQSCGLDGGKRYMTASQSNHDATFQCIANPGIYGDSTERPMQAMLNAAGPLSLPGECNAGFVRDDAILVVTIITDEEEHPGKSPGDPASWKADLIAAKGGNETAVVVLGLVGDTGLPGAVCPPDSIPGSSGGEYAPRLRAFVESFGERGFLGSVCEADYGPFFQAAVDVVDHACDEYVPAG